MENTKEEYSVAVRYDDDRNAFDLYEEHTGTLLETADAFSIRRSDMERMCRAAFEAGRSSR